MSAGLNAGILWAGMMIVVFLEILRAVFSARCFTMKLPNPRRYTFSPCARLSLIEVIRPSTIEMTLALSMPVVLAISVTISAFVIGFGYIVFKSTKLAKNPNIWNSKLSPCRLWRPKFWWFSKKWRCNSSLGCIACWLLWYGNSIFWISATHHVYCDIRQVSGRRSWRVRRPRFCSHTLLDLYVCLGGRSRMSRIALDLSAWSIFRFVSCVS